MTSIGINIPNDGAALPELPPLSIRELVVGTNDLLFAGRDLPQPVHITIDDTQCITLQFDPEPSSLRAITRWALHFGGVMVSGLHQTKHGPQTWCRTEFDYSGVTVRAFAHIPAGTATT